MTTFCQATLNYVGGEVSSQAGRHQSTVSILDGRVADLPGWQECGFELVHHSSAVTDWDDADEIAAVHYPEVEELARKMTSADVALVSSHIRRSPEAAKRHQQLSPIQFVHSDFAEGHDEIIRRSYHDGREGAAKSLARNDMTAEAVAGAARIVILQFWRNIGPTKMDHPVAFCDARTVTPAQTRAFHVTNYAGSGANFDALAVMAPERASDHAWYAFPELTRDEAVAFRTYDTDLVRARKTYFTPHSAFRDPDVEVGQPARSSVELRATCVFA